MMMSVLVKFMFPAPASLVVSVMSVISLVSLANGGLSEIRGKHMNYSKFWNVNAADQRHIKLSTKTTMLLLYTPAFLATAASFWFFPSEGVRSTILQSAVTIHFLKGIFEVLFIHKYSGFMVLGTTIPIRLSYFLSTTTMIYAQHLTHGLPQPPINLMYPGIVLFLVGISGNFYHHYLFEIIVFYRVFFISQTLYAFSFSTGTAFCLMGRSYATRSWYLSKFEDFPNDVKAIIPFVF